MSKFDNSRRNPGVVRLFLVAIAAALLLAATSAQAGIDGVVGPQFNLTASADYISMPDGASIYTWGYGVENGAVGMQLPGPTLIVTQGQTVVIRLTNNLPPAAGNVSMVFPGQQANAIGGVPGLLTQEASPGASVIYTFQASQPGTYLYHSGTRPDLQVEMGLYGALIVRSAAIPAGCNHAAYNHAGSCYDREYLFLISELDLDVHRAAEAQIHGPGPIQVEIEPYWPEYWMINGRAAMDTLDPANEPTLPHQPYNSLPLMQPGERLLQRVIGAGRQMHPFHFHGNSARVLAFDGKLLLSPTDPSKLGGPILFTHPVVPGGTVDAIFTWTGKDLGWDMYGDRAHVCNGINWAPGQPAAISAGYDPVSKEWCADHGKPLPVQLPDPNVLTNGALYAGSPYLGSLAQLPPGEGGMNPWGGYSYMWHSHTEKELTNKDIFPGGLMSMLIITPPGSLPSE
jgi:FtsP/CotA-like multicopper oxidase with cupredoxin domain